MKNSRNAAVAIALGLIYPSAAVANGLGEDRPYQFRTANERQVLLNLERTRLELQRKFPATGVGSSAGLGTQQTGNSTTITISGSGNTITTSQTNTGGQSISQTSSNNSILNN
ncbi:hypothetical protein H6M51_16055 [Rhizobium sp. AQ_MP]|uniref:hypothetical protein n=1 Tax=Rhizobium sp. AQ_MP TaxID=2761536 RepID=UPI00163B40A1|nr:hypothetical protein [Rhizobium sp. AQ_MP]MBC2774380.1 hypothetical protein [Rhizobium sp. AQ_MP]